MGGAKFHYLGSSFMHKKNTTISTHAPRISARYLGHEIKNHENKNSGPFNIEDFTKIVSSGYAVCLYTWKPYIKRHHFAAIHMSITSHF